MKTSSAKNKGRRLQKKVVEAILDWFNCECGLEKDDVTSRSMGAGGEDILLSPKARSMLHGLSIECKNNELSKTIFKWFQQAQDNCAGVRATNPVLIMSCNNQKHPLALITFDFLMYLMFEIHQLNMLLSEEVVPNDSKET